MFTKWLLALAVVVCGAAVNAQITFTQSTNPGLVEPGNSVACTFAVGQSSAENSYCRAYTLGVPTTVTAIRAGIELDGGPTTVDIRFWTYAAAPAFTTQVGVTTTFTTPGDGSWDEEVVTIQLDRPVSLAAGNVLVEFHVNDNSLVNGVFFYGSNNDGQLGDSYLASTACGINVPTATSAIGVPDMHIILDIIGYESPASPPDPAISVRFPSNAGHVVPPGGTLVAGAFAPSALANINIEIFNRGAFNPLTHNVVTSAPVGCTLGTAILPPDTQPGLATTLTVPVTPSAGIGTFSFQVTVNNNDAGQPVYSFTVSGSRGMAGTFTVDTAAAANYSDIGDAFDDLEAFGMVAPVVLLISGGPYTPTFSYGLGSHLSLAKTPVRGNSATNTITIRGAAGQTPVIDGGGLGTFVDPISGNEQGCMSLHGLTSVTVENLEFTNADGFGLFVSGSKVRGEIARTLDVRRCAFNDITSGAGLTVIHDFFQYDNLTIENCMVHSCGVGATGSYGPNLKGSISVFHAGVNCTIQHNSILHNIGAGGTAINGCVGFSGSPFLNLPAVVNFNAFSTTVTGKAVLVFPGAPAATPNFAEPSVADRNVYHATTGVNLAHAYAVAAVAPLPATEQANYLDLAAWQTAFVTLDANSIAFDPRFVSTTSGSVDLHTANNSPALELAVGSTATVDFDGDARPIGANRDTGADERAAGGLQITTTALLDAAAGLAYESFVNATVTGASGPFQWSMTGQPAWLQISGTALTGRLFGSPQAGDVGTTNFDVTVAHPGGSSDTRQFTLRVLAAGSLIITTSDLPDGSKGKDYDENITSVGGAAPFTWQHFAGDLPPGLSLGASSTNTVALEGEPTTEGTFNFTIRVADAAAGESFGAYSVTIGLPVTPPSTPSGSGSGCSAVSAASPLIAVSAAVLLMAIAVRRRRKA